MTLAASNNSMTNQNGVSLVQLMISTAIGIFLLFGMVEIFTNGAKSRQAAGNLGRAQGNGIAASALIIDEIKRAGYLGLSYFNEGSIKGLPGPQVPTSTCQNNTSWARMIERPLFALNDSAASYNCIPNSGAGAYLRGDVLTVRYASPWELDLDAGDVLGNNQLYIRSSVFTARLLDGAREADGSNTLNFSMESLHELMAFNFYIGDSDRSCSNGASIPSLFRIGVNNNGQPGNAEELIPGIEDFQIQFTLDGNNFQDAQALSNDDWDNILAVQIWLLTRSECAEVGTYGGPLELAGKDYVVPAGEENYRRKVYTRIISLRNTRAN